MPNFVLGSGLKSSFLQRLLQQTATIGMKPIGMGITTTGMSKGMSYINFLEMILFV